MSLKRDTLKGFGLSEEQINSIIADHTATVDGVKNSYEKQISTLQTEIDAAAANKTDLDKKYKDEHDAFESYKAEIAKRDSDAKKSSAYRAKLTEIGISSKRADAILKMTDLSQIELDKNGELKNSDKIEESIRADWADMIPAASQVGASVTTPPANNGGTSLTKEQILAIKDSVERQRAIAENIELFTQKG